MHTILIKIFVFICLCGYVQQVKAQAPVRRLEPAKSSIRGNIPRPPVHKDYKLMLAEIQRKYPDHAKQINTSSRMPGTGFNAGSRFRSDRTAAARASTQAHRQRLMQRFPRMQQKAKGFTTLSTGAPMNYMKVAAAQRELARKRMEEHKRRDLK